MELELQTPLTSIRIFASRFFWLSRDSVLSRKLDLVCLCSAEVLVAYQQSINHFNSFPSLTSQLCADQMDRGHVDLLTLATTVLLPRTLMVSYNRSSENTCVTHLPSSLLGSMPALPDIVLHFPTKGMLRVGMLFWGIECKLYKRWRV